MNFNKSFDVSPELRNILSVRYTKKPTKNYIAENIKNLRQMQHQMSVAKKELEEKKKPIKSLKRTPFTVFKGVNKPMWVRYNPSSSEGEQSEKSTSDVSYDVETISENTSIKQLVDQGVQTSPLTETEDDEISTQEPISQKPDRITKFASAKVVDTFGQDKPLSKGKKDNLNFVELNRRMEYKCKVTKEEKPNPNGIPPKYQLGELPRYLRDRKKTNVQTSKIQEEPFLNTNEHWVDQPVEEETKPGYVLLDDDERIEHLKMMNKCYEQLLLELNQLPVRSDTLRSKQKRAELEKKLEELENTIKIFSRQKLFIKL